MLAQANFPNEDVECLMTACTAGTHTVIPHYGGEAQIRSGLRSESVSLSLRGWGRHLRALNPLQCYTVWPLAALKCSTVTLHAERLR